MIRSGLRNLMRHSPRLFLLALMPLLAACGVEFRYTFEGTELFKAMSISGERQVGEELTVSIEVSQVYPVPVRVACYVSNEKKRSYDEKNVAFEERARLIGETILPPATDRRPDEEAPREVLSYQFRVDEAGEYLVACLTPGAAENGWGMGLRVRG
jgi:hypothetical protein